MSNLYASINADASKTQATRRGHRQISAHVRGWETGAEVDVFYNPTNECTTVRVYRTSGSNGAGSRDLIAEWQQSAGSQNGYAPAKS